MHSLSEIYSNLSIQSGLLWLALIILISGIYSKKSSLSVFSLIIIGIVWYKMSGPYSADGVSYIGIHMMLISTLAYFSSGIKKLSAFLTYLLFASLMFFGLHSFIPHNLTAAFKSLTLEVPLDQDAELLVKFDSQKDLKEWMNENQKTYDIIYPAFTPKDKSYNLDEYLIVNIKSSDDINKKMVEIEKMALVTYVEGNEIL